ncbi:alpha/beta fold hydrolase [Serpentinicella sp. ANB-PHB4]|uniref:alpha/beta fold hydrolase n=1 Tax=Serpentinicella sp. ANB-PHB4 TaxID=3074076 RepID=UPI002860CDD9|nr:alpha/beta fold hydrolase [Serpentinicella sp. ANB-PHB4]MDR5659326.1 alpha/beta fold hydrolase [Serpentinicella sp. ANB-PHB4]
MIVQKKSLTLPKPFITEHGEKIENPVVTYEAYGNPEGDVIMVCHGGLSSQHAAGKYTNQDAVPGWWDDIIGDDKAIDTRKYRVISANALGSMFGTSSPLSLNPKTGTHYGPDFPFITLIDITRFNKAFLDELGIKKLKLIAGPSMGSLISLQMAALYPTFVENVVAVATAGRMTPSGMAIHHFMMNTIKMDSAFNEGWYSLDKPLPALRLIHQISRIYYTHERLLQHTYWDNVPESSSSQFTRSENCLNYLTDQMEKQIQRRDPNCFISILSAINTYDLGRDADSYEAGVQRIQCPTLLININTDSEFSPKWAQEVANILNQKQEGQAKAVELDSMWGHLGCVQEAKSIGEEIKKYIHL